MKTLNFIVLFSFVLGLSLLGTNVSSMAAKNISSLSAERSAYCSQRYRSFNPKTGYFTNYDGRKILCAEKVRYIHKGNSNPWPPYPRTGKTFKQWQDCVFGAAGGREGYSASDCSNQ